MRIATFIVLAVLTLAATAATSGSVQRRLKHGSEVYELAEFTGENDPDYFGTYASRFSVLGGPTLHLFPSGRFAVTLTSDIAPDVAMATGTYAVQRSELKLTFEHIASKGQPIAEEFIGLHMAWGWINRGSYVTGDAVFMCSAEEWRKVSEQASDRECLSRGVVYEDWQRIQQRLDAELLRAPMPNNSLERSRER